MVRRGHVWIKKEDLMVLYVFSLYSQFLVHQLSQRWRHIFCYQLELLGYRKATEDLSHLQGWGWQGICPLRNSAQSCSHRRLHQDQDHQGRWIYVSLCKQILILLGDNICLHIYIKKQALLYTAVYTTHVMHTLQFIPASVSCFCQVGECYRKALHINSVTRRSAWCCYPP